MRYTGGAPSVTPIMLITAVITLRVGAAVVNFCVAIGCMIYIRFAARELRWSRTYRRFLTKHDQPNLYWTKFYLAVAGVVFTIAIGVLILIPHKRTSNFDFFQLPELERGKSSKG